MNISLLMMLILILPLAGQTSKGGRWQFENDGEDTAEWDQTANPGNLVNQATFDSTAPRLEGSYYLNLDPAAANDYFLVPDDGDLDFQDEDIAISLWIYPLGFGDTQYLVSKGIQNTNPKSTNYALRLESSTGNLSFLIRDANNQAQVVTAEFAVPEEAWTFIAAYYDYSSEQVYFWDTTTASPADTQAFAQSYFSNDGPLAVGSWYTSDSVGVKHFNGRIDDLRISGRLDDVFPGNLAIRPGGAQRISSDGLELNLYPNPVSLGGGGRSLTIRMNALYEPTTVIIYDLLGQEVYRKVVLAGNPETFIQWNLTEQSGSPIGSGIYFLVRQSSSSLAMKRFTILK
jgi:hypothetical protein